MGKFAEFIKYVRDGFPVNRPLTKMERACHLPQGKPSPIPVAFPQLSVVRMNSTYLECVDVNFMRKGAVTVGGFFILAFSIYFIFAGIDTIITDWHKVTESNFIAMLSFGIFAILIGLFLMVSAIWLLRLDSFDYTCHPMRFNRKTRMVYAFYQWQKGKKGEIISAPWDELFFTSEFAFKQGEVSDFIIHAHKLAEDGNTVLATFQLAHHSEKDNLFRFSQWEFVRQYMEGDDKKVAELADMVDEVVGVGGRRETFYESFRQAWMSFGGQSWSLILLPFIAPITLGRQIAMWTSKIPVWPDEIEAECQYSPDDPNLRDDKHLVSHKTAQLHADKQHALLEKLYIGQ